MLPRSLLVQLLNLALYVGHSFFYDFNVLIWVLPQPCIGPRKNRISVLYYCDIIRQIDYSIEVPNLCLMTWPLP